MNLTTEQIIEYNILLAEFEGWELVEHVTKIHLRGKDVEFKENWFHKGEDMKPVFIKKYGISRFNYHSDWRELMRVWGKAKQEASKHDEVKDCRINTGVAILKCDIIQAFEELVTLVTELNKIKQ